MKWTKAEFFKDVLNEEKKVFTEEEAIEAIRGAIAAEYDAIQTYTKFRNAIRNSFAEKVFDSIIEEEKVHVGEFQALLERFSVAENAAYQKGKQEVQQMENES